MFKLVEKFKSIQSEGFHAGTPAVFLRFYGCNLDCVFGDGKVCDESLHTDTTKIRNTTLQEILGFARGTRHVVITGGEPSLQDLNPLIEILKGCGHYVQVETNGYKLNNIVCANWITYSPKTYWSDKAEFTTKGFDELKLLVAKHFSPKAELWKDVYVKYVQPIGTENGWDLDNVRFAAEWVIANPGWKLSLQTHKIYGGQ